MKSKPTKVKDNIEIHNFIISKIRDYINLRKLRPGDKLPSERTLSQQLNVSRRNVREAIEKLEFYEIVRSIPHTGTFVADIGQIAIGGIIQDIITLKEEDFLSLVETRLMLEAKSASLAAKRRTVADLEHIKNALVRYKIKILSGQDALQEDLLFHLAIAKASKNSTINALMLQITPKIITTFEKTRVDDIEGFDYEVKNHEAIFNAIKEQNPEKAVKAIEFHFKLLVEYCNDFKNHKSIISFIK